MNYIKKVLGEDLRQYTMVVALAALIIIFNIASGGKMVTSSNFQNLISGNAYVLVLALGMLMVIVIGQIDLSVGSVAGFASMVMAITARQFNLPWYVAILIALVIGMIAVAWQGFFLSRLGIPGFITTLGGMMIFRGGVIWISNSISVPVPSELKWFGAGYLPEWGPAFTGMNNSTLLLGILAIAVFVTAQLRKFTHSGDVTGKKEEFWPYAVRIGIVSVVIGYATWLFGSGRVGTSFPIPGLILVILIILYYLITERTSFGRHVYAVGGNKAAAELSGVNVKKWEMLAFVICGMCAGIAAIFFVGAYTTIQPGLGDTFNNEAIASCVMGGTSMSGGLASIGGSFIGVMIISLLQEGILAMGIQKDWQYVITGVIVLVAVTADIRSRRRKN